MLQVFAIYKYQQLSYQILMARKQPVDERSAGFTFVELLVVISVITILGALLLPALSAAKFQARTTSCKSNLRQVGIAMALYTGTYGGYLPFDSFPEASGQLRYQWYQLLEPYLFSRPSAPFNSGSGPSSQNVNSFFLCPFFSSPKAGMPFEYSFLKLPLYGYNTLGVGSGEPIDFPIRPSLGLAQLPITQVNTPPKAPTVIVKAIRDDTVHVPSDMIGIGDPFVRGELPDQDGAFQYDWGWRPIHGWIFGGGYMEKSRRAAQLHGRSFNRWFCDGHVESENAKKPFAATDTDLKKWNSDNLPHRDQWVLGGW